MTSAINSSEWPDYDDSLQGYNDQDYNTVNDALNSSAVKELDLDFAKLAREVPRPKQRTGDDDDDMGGGLCWMMQ